MLAASLDAEPVKPRRVRLMFQDEARFGRLVRIKRCWAPLPLRPVVDNGYEDSSRMSTARLVLGKANWIG